MPRGCPAQLLPHLQDEYVWDYLTTRVPIDTRKEQTLERFSSWLTKLLMEAALMRFAVDDYTRLGMAARAPEEVEDNEWAYANGHTRASTLRASLWVLDHVLRGDLATTAYVGMVGTREGGGVAKSRA